jgi:hypothetical protein
MVAPPAPGEIASKIVRRVRAHTSLLGVSQLAASGYRGHHWGDDAMPITLRFGVLIVLGVWTGIIWHPYAELQCA